MDLVDYYQARLNEGFAEIGRVTRKLAGELTMECTIDENDSSPFCYRCGEDISPERCIETGLCETCQAIDDAREGL